MRVLISGVCGFVGSTIVRSWAESGEGYSLHGIDSLIRPGSETNRRALRRIGVDLIHADIRAASDFESLPAVDWVVDAAANPTVLAGVDGRTSSRQIVEHNLVGTINLLEYCRVHGAGLILLSTSRVYSIAELSKIQVEERDGAFRAVEQDITGLSACGIAEGFSTQPPLSLYGTTKLASEQLALEYGAAFGFPVWINRCGVLAGGGQFGRADQGIFSFWIHSWARRRRLTYIGFGGAGYQVRDCLHPHDLSHLLSRQFDAGDVADKPRVVNISGGVESACSLRQISEWCSSRFGPNEVAAVEEQRPFDVPWVVLDSTVAAREWGWAPTRRRETIFEEIAAHAEADPEWLETSA